MHYTLPTPGTLVADKYRIEELLGRGGMGSVFRARHELMDKRVALKWLHPEFSYDVESRERFLREARALARIQHPNVVQVFDVGLHRGALYIVMELLEGLSFESILVEGALPIPRALGLLLGAMRGVAEAHAHGVIHRDIKPDNIFVVCDAHGSERVAKVLDFGISKLLDDAERGQHLTQTGEVLGTPEYMSYEHMSGARDIDARSDVYSFGVLLYRALTGVSPFDADSVAGVAVRVATHRPPGPKQLRPHLPGVLDAVVMKAMAFERADRYPDMRALIDALTQVASTEGFLQALTRPSAKAQLGPLHAADAAEPVPPRAQPPRALREPRPVETQAELPLPAAPRAPELPSRPATWQRGLPARRLTLVAASLIALGVGGVLAAWTRHAATGPETEPAIQPAGAAAAQPVMAPAEFRSRADPRASTQSSALYAAPAPATLDAGAGAPGSEASVIVRGGGDSSLARPSARFDGQAAPAVSPPLSPERPAGVEPHKAVERRRPARRSPAQRALASPKPVANEPARVAESNVQTPASPVSLGRSGRVRSIDF